MLVSSTLLGSAEFYLWNSPQAIRTRASWNRMMRRLVPPLAPRFGGGTHARSIPDRRRLGGGTGRLCEHSGPADGDGVAIPAREPHLRESDGFAHPARARGVHARIWPILHRR